MFFFAMFHTFMTLKTVLSFKIPEAIFALMAGTLNVSLGVFLHVMFPLVGVAALDTDKVTLRSPLEQSLRAETTSNAPDWKYHNISNKI